MRPFRRLLVALVVAGLAAPTTGVAAPVTRPECRPIAVPASTTLPVGATTCEGVRPGALVETSKGFCTLNFVFYGSDGYRYVGTAGHCILGSSALPENVGERVWGHGKGPAAFDIRGRRIGRFVYAIYKDPKDFALIRVDAGVTTYSRMCHFGGPTRMDRGTDGTHLVHHYGHGIGVGWVAPARTAVTVRGLSDADNVYAWGTVVPGDSGGPLIAEDGSALGVVVTTGVHFAGGSPVVSGLIGASRLAPQVARAAYRLRTTLTLKTASLS